MTTKLVNHMPKILAPAGDMVSLRAALSSGADEIYFGIKGINMRAGARNFLLSDLPTIAKLCHTNVYNGKKKRVLAFLALNTIIYDSEKKLISTILKKVKSAKIDAVICWDMSIVQMCTKLKIPVHLSTQASVSNAAALEFYAQAIPTLERVVLARECTSEDISTIAKHIQKKKLSIELETFIHGAMCVSVSGRCFMSQQLFNKSANRGECLQPCRRNYEVTLHDSEEKHDLKLGSDYVMSPQDLCTLPFIEQLIELGITSFKIEGRNRSPEYVKTVVSCYREAIDYYMLHRTIILKKKEEQKKYQELKTTLVKKLQAVYNRGFSSGFFHGKPVDAWCHEYGSVSKQIKELVGKVTNYYSKSGIAELKIESKLFTNGDTLFIMGPTTGVVEILVTELRTDSGKPIKQGDIVTIPCKTLVRKNDAVYVVRQK